MRTFYSEVRAEAPPPKRWWRVVYALFRWLTLAFAAVSVWIDMRLASGLGDRFGAYEQLLRTVLLEIEAYLVFAVLVMSLRVAFSRREPETPPRRRA